MAENESFFRKVVRFVANPATEWTELGARPEDSRELDLEKSELKAMIERKRRNDFVRKREFDMLRQVRREGLSPEQLAALGGSSRLDDSEARLPDNNSRPSGVKAKIDEIEQQMVGDGFAVSSRRPTGPLAAGTEPATAAPYARAVPAVAPDSVRGGRVVDEALARPSLSPLAYAPLPAPALGGHPAHKVNSAALAAGPAAPLSFKLPPQAAPSPVQMAGGLPPLAPLSTVSFGGPGSAGEPSDFSSPFAVEVSEVVHDPELDEAVIAFANADFTQCEEALQHLTAPGGQRAQHAETWLVLFDLYRATGQQQRFESLAMDYAQQFGWSAPQWYSLPKLVADAQAEEPIRTTSPSGSLGDVGWVCPDLLDTEAVTRLRSQTLQMPLPWVFDFTQLARVDAEAATQLSMLFRLWAGQAIEMRWIAGERLFTVLHEAAPTGVRDADPAFWLTRMDALRLANRADQFDEAAIDYCVTYEVSPPSWEAARCQVHVGGASLSTRAPAMSLVSDVSTSFMESHLTEDVAGGVEMAHVELSGQLVGDIGATLTKLNARLGAAPVVSVSCARLIRVDFIAAGDLLNWVLSKGTEQRSVHFVDTHRLLALFFGAMGINEHAKVQVRKV